MLCFHADVLISLWILITRLYNDSPLIRYDKCLVTFGFVCVR